MLSKEKILKKVTINQIYENYLNQKFVTNKNISSPFSEDKNPSFRLYENGTFKCNSNGNQGDVWQFVADIKEIDCKQNFKKVLETISKDLNINNKTTIINNPKKTINTKSELKTIEHKNKFTAKALDYWLNLGVNELILQSYNVGQVSKFHYTKSNGELIKFPVYSGVLAFSYPVNNNYEIYIPEQQKVKKFFYNGLSSTDIFGLKQLPKKTKNIIITAGKKDAIVTSARDYNCVSFRSENHNPTKKQIDLLKSKCNNLFICYDNDFSKTINSGQIAQDKLVKKFNLTPILLPSKINDLTDYFKEYKKEDFEKLLKKSQIKPKEELEETPIIEHSGTTIFHIVEQYLKQHYDLRFNEILLDVEYKKKNSKNWQICNEDSLFIEMQKKNINIQMAKLISILKSDFVKKYNPIKNYFEQLPKWDGKINHIEELCKYVETPNKKQFQKHLTKWMARAVKTMLVDGYFNKQAFILTDKGAGQNIGKSHFTKWICPPNFPINRSFEDSKKDNLIKLATNSFILLDELDGISKKDINSLKALFSMDEIRVRLPYGRREETVQRIASFIGSTNEESFLVDPTGSVRWLVFHVSKLDWNYSKNINVNNLWSQAHYLAFSDAFDETFNAEDVKENESRNEAYQVLSSEAEMIKLMYEKPTQENQHRVQFLTSTEILIMIKVNSSLTRVSPIGVGRALKLLKYDRIKKNGVYGYNLVPTNKIIGEIRN